MYYIRESSEWLETLRSRGQAELGLEDLQTTTNKDIQKTSQTPSRKSKTRNTYKQNGHWQKML